MSLDAEIFGRFAAPVTWLAAFLAATAASAVIAERVAFAIGQARRRRVEARYVSLVQRAVAGDDTAVHMLTSSPRRDRFAIAELLIMPLIDDRDPHRIARTRQVVEAMSLLELAEHLLNSRRWWRRAVALRAIGLLQARSHTAQVIAALDDRHTDVRAAAMDALTDLHDPASLPALVVRLLDTSLQRGRRVAALTAFGDAAEPLLRDLAQADAAHRLGYARALAICGTPASRPLLRSWAVDGNAELRAAAFDALARTGLDTDTAAAAFAGLESPHVEVRAAAARALHGWTGTGDAVSHLARHLDDDWRVATRAARSLQAIQPRGHDALREAAARTDLAGLLARQMLWLPEAGA